MSIGYRGLHRHSGIARVIFSLLLALSACFFPLQAATAEGDEPLFAVVNGTAITQGSYALLVRNEGKNRFYHGTPPEGEFDRFKVEMGQLVIDSTLLLQEAERQQIAPDQAWVTKQFDRWFASAKAKMATPDEQALAQQQRLVRSKIEERSRVDLLKLQVRDAVAEPTPAQLDGYYRNNLDKFTSPEQISASIILLKVNPWASSAEWLAAKEKAELLHDALLQGGDFAEMARDFSDDNSAGQGGALGYLHDGMLGEAAQLALGKLKPGEHSEPTRLLEGFALLRLDDRRDPVVNPLSRVEARAKDLWRREAEERAEISFIEKLRLGATITIVDQPYLELAKRLERERAEEKSGAVADPSSQTVRQ